MFGPKRLREPRRPAQEKAFHVLPPDKWNMFAETLTIQLNQPVTMFILLPGHCGEEFRRGREIRAERFGKIAIDASIFFLRRDGEGQNLRLVQVTEVDGLSTRRSAKQVDLREAHTTRSSRGLRRSSGQRRQSDAPSWPHQASVLREESSMAD